MLWSQLTISLNEGQKYVQNGACFCDIEHLHQDKTICGKFNNMYEKNGDPIVLAKDRTTKRNIWNSLVSKVEFVKWKGKSWLPRYTTCPTSPHSIGHQVLPFQVTHQIPTQYLQEFTLQY